MMLYPTPPLQPEPARPAGGLPLSQHIRPARPDDVPAILALVNDHARRGDLLPRTAAAIAASIDDWLVAEDDAGIVACVCLMPYTPLLAEVRSLAVHDRAKGQGWGSALVQALIRSARGRGIPTLFTLTRAVIFFRRLGFTPTERHNYPQKVWKDCTICPLQEHCDETAMSLTLFQ